MSASPHLPAPASRLARRQRRTAGSVLLVAMLFSMLIAIALSSYIRLALNSMKLADRSSYHNAAMNLAEIGIEEAIFSYNKLNDVPPTSPRDAWEPYGWTVAADNSATRTISGFNVGPGVTGEVKIHCSLYNPTSPTQHPVIITRATLGFPNAPSTSKYIEVTLRKRALFPQGMVVQDTIRAVGGDLSLDSWDSGDDGDPSTPMVAYSLATRHANATLATKSGTDDAIDIGNGNVYGFISTTGGRVKHGPTAILTGDFASTEFDAQRVSNDFDAPLFPPIAVPTAAANNVAADIGATTLPRAGDTAAADGCYYYNFVPGVHVALNTGTLRISGKVVFLLTNHTGVSAIDAGGSSAITIDSGASLKVYTNGNVTISGGGGLSNGNSEPSTCVFFGNHPTPRGQSFTLNGNGHTSVSLYAPNGLITLSGGGSGGDFYGAIVGYSVSLTGTTRFHYDEALARLYTGEPFGVAKWRELKTSTERDVYAARLSF